MGRKHLFWFLLFRLSFIIALTPSTGSIQSRNSKFEFFLEGMSPLTSLFGAHCFALLMLLGWGPSRGQLFVETDLDATLDCNRRTYNHKVIQTDSEGRICWDMVSVVSCWGRCDSNEVSDWRFPYKRSHHPVCIHGERAQKTVTLSNCEDGVEPGTEIHEFMEALTCGCSLCKTSEANCQGLRFNGEGEVFRFERT